MGKGRKQKCKQGIELDLLHNYPLCLFGKAGVKAKVKRTLNKRARLEAKAEIEGEIDG